MVYTKDPYAGRRALYASNITDDYMRYVDKGIEEGKTGDDFMAYVSDEEKSSGLFGKDGMLSKEQKAEMRKQLRETGSVIWDAVVSFKKEFGTRHMTDANTA